MNRAIVIAFILAGFFALDVLGAIGLANEDRLVYPAEYIKRDDFCTRQAQYEKKDNKSSTFPRSTKTEIGRTCSRLNQNYLKFFFSLFVILGWGALVRTILRTFKLNIPYTVVLMASGLLVGLGSRINTSICEIWTIFTKIARTPPEIILYVFLPVLIFESAFSMKAHVFMRSLTQILIVALPGMLITTFLTAAACRAIMLNYDWTLTQASLFGSIISATDPVAVVAILRELGTSEMLSVMVEGESLLNDGVAILLYDIFKDIVQEPDNTEDPTQKIFFKFVKITIGGPVFGWVMAKLAIAFLSQIFNDAATEITITLVAAYLTYFVGEQYLGVSGVMAVVILGITMSAESTSISPEVQTTVHHFWEMLSYLANTVLFVLVGIVITETAINSFQMEDGYYLIALYFVLTLTRLLMLILVSPIIARLGYGITWKNLIVMTWGGLRGAVGICLALEVYKNKHLCQMDKIGPKFLLQTAGIVILTLAVNGSTTKMLLDALKVTEISMGKLQDMANAVKQLQSARQRTMGSLTRDRFLADANWDIVQESTLIANPYQHERANFKNKVAKVIAEKFQFSIGAPRSEKPKEEIKLNPEEYKALTEEARLRILKAIKISYWRQFEKGVLSEEAVQILVGLVEVTEDRELSLVHTSEMKKYWKVRGLAPKLRSVAISALRLTEDKDGNGTSVVPPPPKSKWRLPIYKLVTQKWFEYLVYLIILVNMIPIGYEIYFLVNHMDSPQPEFIIISASFTTIYFLEFLFKVIAFKKKYFSDPWNCLDFGVLIISLLELCAYFYLHTSVFEGKSKISDPLKFGEKLITFLKNLRLLRIIRTFRWGRAIIPWIIHTLNNRVNEQLFLGYDIGKGFVCAIDDVMKFLPQIIENAGILKKLKFVLEGERLEAVREMGLLQREHPGVAIGVKTRHASRTVLNQMRDHLKELKEDGLLDDKEFSILILSIEENMKRLWISPASIPPAPPELLISNVSWIVGNDEIRSYVMDHIILLHYNQGDTVCESGEPADGIFVVISGLIKIHYEPTDQIIQARENWGQIPNTEMIFDLTFQHFCNDFFSTGTVIGELGVLTKQLRAATVICETGVTMYHISQDVMLAAIDRFTHPYDSLQSRMWRACGMRLAGEYLPTQPSFFGWTADKIKTHLERSAVPIGEQYAVMNIPEYVCEIILIYGQLVDYNTKEVFTAPCLLPPSCTKICRKDNNPLIPYFLVIAEEEQIVQLQEDGGSATSLQNCVLAAVYANQGLNARASEYVSTHAHPDYQTVRSRAEAERDHHRHSFDVILGRNAHHHQAYSHLHPHERHGHLTHTHSVAHR